MTAVASPPSAMLQQPSNHENLRQFVSDQIRQLSPERSGRQSGRSAVRRRGNSQPVEPTQKPFREAAVEAAAVAAKLQRSKVKEQNGAPKEKSGQSDQDGKPNALARSKTDLDTKRTEDQPTEENWEVRHGYQEQYDSSEFLGALSAVSQDQSSQLANPDPP